jgi:hypothetical protein
MEFNAPFNLFSRARKAVPLSQVNHTNFTSSYAAGRDRLRDTLLQAGKALSTGNPFHTAPGHYRYRPERMPYGKYYARPQFRRNVGRQYRRRYYRKYGRYPYNRRNAGRNKLLGNYTRTAGIPSPTLQAKQAFCTLAVGSTLMQTMAMTDEIGTGTYLNEMAQGNAYHERATKQILIQSLHIRGLIHCVQALVPLETVFCRIMIVYQKNAMGTPPTVAEVFDSSRTARGVLQPRNLVNSDNIVTLVDRVIYAGSGADIEIDVPFNWNLKFNRPLITKYPDTTSELPQQGGIVAYAGWSSSSPSVIEAMFTSRIRYVCT